MVGRSRALSDNSHCLPNMYHSRPFILTHKFLPQSILTCFPKKQSRQLSSQISGRYTFTTIYFSDMILTQTELLISTMKSKASVKIFGLIYQVSD